MKEEHKKTYEKLVKNWSALFKLKVGDMFSIEELAQEVWVAILQAEESDSYDEENDASLETYLGSCIKHHLYRKIQEEVYHTSALGQAEDDEIEDLFADKPEDIVVADDLYQKFKVRVYNLTNSRGEPYQERGLFILERIDKPERAIAEEATALGMEGMSKSMVHKIRKHIRKEFKKMLKE